MTVTVGFLGLDFETQPVSLTLAYVHVSCLTSLDFWGIYGYDNDFSKTRRLIIKL